MYFIHSTLSLKTRSFTFLCISLKHASLAWNKNRQNTAMQPRKDNRSNKLLLGALIKQLLKTQASDISP